MHNLFIHPLFRHSAIILLVVIHQLISFYWYSPYLFGFKWMRLAGYRLSDIPPEGSFALYQPFLISILSSMLICYGLLALMERFNIATMRRGLALALFCWLLVFALMLTHNEFANRPLALTLIDAGRDGVLFAITGLVLPLLTKKTGGVYDDRDR
jgi:hypothetical protein